MKFDTRELAVGRARDGRRPRRRFAAAALATMVATLDDVNFPLSRTLQFRDANLEVVSLVNPPRRISTA
ncbi:MAG: hypothetical protein IPF50_10405 [Proteobacteria bacterium]|nr:hypothetical protein [Pseudomonadota bacterium]